MSTLDRRMFLRGMLYSLLGAVLGWEVEAIAEEEAAPIENETEEEWEFYGDTITMVGRKPDATWDCCTFRPRADYECDPIVQAVRDMGIAARLTLERELGLQGTGNE